MKFDMLRMEADNKKLALELKHFKNIVNRIDFVEESYRWCITTLIFIILLTVLFVSSFLFNSPDCLHSFGELFCSEVKVT